MLERFNRWFHGDSDAVWHEDPAGLPPAAGAYLLWCEISCPAPLPPRFGGLLPTGRYIYAGSARGPGGIQARCRRHLTRGKALRWHIDWITEAADIVRAMAFVDGEECALVRRILANPEVAVPVAGFGSTDCRTCPAHLLAISDPA